MQAGVDVNVWHDGATLPARASGAAGGDPCPAYAAAPVAFALRTSSLFSAWM